MKLKLNKTFFIFLFSVELFSQNQFTITIDSACFHSNNKTNLDGSFGLYGDKSIDKHPFWVKDTLLRVLEFKEKQVLTLTYALQLAI